MLDWPKHRKIQKLVSWEKALVAEKSKAASRNDFSFVFMTIGFVITISIHDWIDKMICWREWLARQGQLFNQRIGPRRRAAANLDLQIAGPDFALAVLAHDQ